jgi:hypothetical protein
MAYLATDDKQDKDQQQAAATVGAVSAPASTTGGFVGSGTAQPSTAGVGSGGSGGWTNIQSYLTANKDSTGSANALQSEGAGIFDKEASNLQKTSQDTKQQAQTEASKNYVAQDQASKMIQDAGKAYNYGPNQTQPYTDIVNNVQGIRSMQYGGPSSYSYGMGGDTQQFGEGMKQDDAFGGIMNQLYNRAAGGTMTTGANALQKQLDTNNEALNTTRQNLLSRYAGLQSDVTNTLADTNAELANQSARFNQNKNDFDTYLQNQRQNNKGDIDRAVKDAELQRMEFMASTPQTIADGQERFGSGVNFSVVPYRETATPTYVGGSANTENIGGVNEQRNQFNALADFLGLGEKIGQSASEYQLGDMYNDVFRDYENGLGANDYTRRTLAQTGADWLNKKNNPSGGGGVIIPGGGWGGVI